MIIYFYEIFFLHIPVLFASYFTYKCLIFHVHYFLSLLVDPYYLLFQMVGRGKAPATQARARTRASATPESSEEHTPQYVFDLLARMQAMEERFAAGPIPAPQPQPVVQPMVAAVVPPGGQPVVDPQL